jgi:hypothetical protein
MEGWFWIFNILLSIFLIINYFYYSKLRKTFKENIQILTKENIRLKKEISAVCKSSIGVGQRLNVVEEYLHNISLRQDMADSHQKPLSSYNHAAKIIAMGGNINDVVDSCGISNAEAELVSILHNETNKI